MMNNQLLEGDLIESFYSKGKKFKFFDVQYMSEGTKAWRRPADKRKLMRRKPLRESDVFGRTPEEVWTKILGDANLYPKELTGVRRILKKLGGA